MRNILRGLALFTLLAVTLSSCYCYRPYGGGYGRGYGGGHHHGGGHGHGGGGHYRR